MGPESNPSNVLIGELTPQDVINLWDSHIYRMLKESGYEAMDPRYSIENIGELLLKGYLNLLAVVVDSEIAALTIVYATQEPQCKFGYILLACGKDVLKWGGKLSDYVRQWFRNIGCDYVQYVSQPGWTRWDKDSKPLGTLYLAKV